MNEPLNEKPFEIAALIHGEDCMLMVIPDYDNVLGRLEFDIMDQEYSLGTLYKDANDIWTWKDDSALTQTEANAIGYQIEHHFD